MGHQPFESWLLSEERLTPDQAQALQAHLETCEVCRRLSSAWSGIEHLFQAVQPIKPAAGFTARWQARLANQQIFEQRARQRRQSWWALLFSFGMAGLLFVLLTVQLLTVFDAPTELFFVGIYRIVGLLTLVKAAQEILSVLPRAVFATVPPVWWAVFAAALGLLSLLWIVALQKFMLPRRITL